MDETRFDDLARWLDAVRSRRTIARLLGGGVLVAPLAAWGLGEAEAKKKKQKKKPVCLCSTTSCQSKKVKNRAKVIQQNAPCAYAGGCTSLNPCAATTTPRPPCTSYTQCGTAPTAGHLACLNGSCHGGNSCTTGGTPCVHPLTCMLPQTPGSTQTQCLVARQCDADDDCMLGMPTNPICVLGRCTRACVPGGDCTPVGTGFTCQSGVCLPA
jgi:hypothetical protein